MLSISNYLVLQADKALVVEPYPIRVLAADCPIIIVFELSRLVVFHTYVVVYDALRGSQQLEEIQLNIAI